MSERHGTFTIYANSGGCPQNQLDGAHVYKYLESNGYVYTKWMEHADIIVINSCAYSSLKENESVETYRSISLMAKKDATIILSGCLPKIAPRRIRELDARATVIAGSELGRIEEVVSRQKISWEESSPNSIPAPVLTYVKPFRRYLNSSLNVCRRVLPYAAARHFDRLLMYDHSPDTFVIQVSQGCLGNCTYCAIRFSRGTLRSKPLDEVLREVQKGVDLNVREILLSGTDLAAYGRERGVDLSVLLSEVLKVATRQYLLLFYANPRWMIDIWDKLEPVFATQRIHFVHLSLNGGSDHVLRGMKRGYLLKEFETLVNSIKKVSPLTVLQTQIITGFPGESQEDFEETVRFLRKIYFHNVQVHAFDPRPGTVASTMTDQVPEHLRQRRRKYLYALTLWSKMKYDVRYIMSGFSPI